MTTTLNVPTQTKQNSKTDLWYTRCPVPTAFTIALQLGLFEKEFKEDEDASFSAIQQSSDPKVHLSHYTHTQHNSFRHGGNVPAIWAKANGADTKIIGLSWVTTPHPILTLPGSGIKTVSDLKGKRLGVATRVNEKAVDFWRSTAIRIYETALATAGLTLDDVKLVEIPVQTAYVDAESIAERKKNPLNLISTSRRGRHRESVLALIRGEVDVIPGQGSGGLEIATFLGAHVVYDVGRQQQDKVARANNALPEALSVSAELIREQPELVTRVVARIIEAAEWAQNHHAEVVRFIAREQGVAEEIIELTYGPELSQTFHVDLSEQKVAALRSQKEFLLKKGFLPKDFDFDSWIDREPLKAAYKLLAERQTGTAPCQRNSPTNNLEKTCCRN